jgi:soluble lytic murein transglycosylase-like protein
MQLIPATASDYGVDDPFDPVSNIEGGVRYLKDLMEYFDGDMKLSLAAYNAGKGAVIKHGFTIPPYPETTDYITKVLGYYKIMKAKNYVSKN